MGRINYFELHEVILISANRAENRNIYVNTPNMNY